MGKQRLNVQTIAEVLMEELAKMDGNTKRIENATKGIEEATEKPLHIDTKELKELIAHQEAIYKRQENLFKEKFHVPKWGLRSTLFFFVIIFLFTIFTAGVSIHYKNKFEEMEKTAEYWYQKAQEN